MTVDEFKIYADWGFRVAQTLATIGVWLYARYIARNKQVDGKFKELEDALREEIRSDVGDMGVKLEKHERREEERDEAIDNRLDALEVAGARTPTMQDLSAIHEKLNATNGTVAQMVGELKGVNENLRLILSRIAEKGMT